MPQKVRLRDLGLREWVVISVTTILGGEIIKWFAKEVMRDLFFGSISDLLRPWLAKMLTPELAAYIAELAAPYAVAAALVVFLAWWFYGAGRKSQQSQAVVFQNQSGNDTAVDLRARAKAVLAVGQGRARYAKRVLEENNEADLAKWLRKADDQRVDFPLVVPASATGITEDQRTLLAACHLLSAELDRCINNIVAGRNYESPQHAVGLYIQRLDRLLISLSEFIARLSGESTTHTDDVGNKCRAVDRVLDQVDRLRPIIAQINQLQSGWRNWIGEQKRRDLITALQEVRTQIYEIEGVGGQLRREYAYYPDISNVIDLARLEEARMKFDKFIGAIGMIGDDEVTERTLHHIQPYEQQCIEGTGMLQRLYDNARQDLINIRMGLSQ